MPLRRIAGDHAMGLKNNERDSSHKFTPSKRRVRIDSKRPYGRTTPDDTINTDASINLRCNKRSRRPQSSRSCYRAQLDRLSFGGYVMSRYFNWENTDIYQSVSDVSIRAQYFSLSQERSGSRVREGTNLFTEMLLFAITRMTALTLSRIIPHI